jgi:soluble lytic murein transglycosylase
VLARADRFLDGRDYARARSEYRALLDQLSGPPRDRARVRIGAADFLAGNSRSGCEYLRTLDLPQSEADAERLYYLEECGRRMDDDGAMMDAVRTLGKRYPQSQWRLKALISAANRFLLANRVDDFVPLYQEAYENFPTAPSAGLCHWKVTFNAYLRGRPEAATLLKEHLVNYPGHLTAGAALYFYGRLAELNGDPGTARAFYQRLTGYYQNLYYAMRARDRLKRPEVEQAAIPASAATLLNSLRLPPAVPVPAAAARDTSLRIARSRLLRTAGLAELADAELRFGARTDGEPALLAMEMADAAEATHVSLRVMKMMVPDYLNIGIDQAPRRFWELLFPLPFRGDLTRSARERNLDPNLLAGLIRQESEFNPQALSHAKAYGLTQVRPSTGKLYARKAGVSRFSSRLLFQPAANLKIGASILKSMLDDNGGRLEETLAAYNAGPNRAAEWLTWNKYREPAEFVEAIPFTETRDYVQAVMRNADMYRRLY